MKIHTRKVTKEIYTYIADDGMEFNTRQACEDHDLWLKKNKLETIFHAVPKFEYSPPFDTSCDATWRWMYVSTMEQFNVIREVLFDSDASGYEYEPDEAKFPCWLLFHNDEYGMGDVDGTIGDVGAAMTDYLLKVGERFQQYENLLQLKEGETK